MRSIILGAAAGLAWSATMRIYMRNLVGDASRVNPRNTIVGIMLPGAITGAMLAHSADLRAVDPERNLDQYSASPLVFDDATARPIDLDLRGSDEAVLERLDDDPVGGIKPAPRAPGRPKLGVVAREVTLLPRHWDWLNSQPGGASVVLRRLVDEARHASPVADKVRRARETTYRFMTAMAGNQPCYEEAIRALFAGDCARYHALIESWPFGVKFYAGMLALDAFEEEP